MLPSVKLVGEPLRRPHSAHVARLCGQGLMGKQKNARRGYPWRAFFMIGAPAITRARLRSEVVAPFQGAPLMANCWSSGIDRREDM